MRFRNIVVLILVVIGLGVAALVWAADAGVVTTVRSGTDRDAKQPGLDLYTITLVSDDSGDAEEASDIANAQGEIVKVTTDPSDGSTSPTTLWDLTILDASGYDILEGLGADRSASASETFVPRFWDTTTTETRKSSPVYQLGALTPVGDNMGSTRTATVYLLVKRPERP